MTEVRVRTSLSRAPKQPMTAEELFEMRRGVWILQAQPCFDLERIMNWARRLEIIDEANQQYGQTKVDLSKYYLWNDGLSGTVK